MNRVIVHFLMVGLMASATVQADGDVKAGELKAKACLACHSVPPNPAARTNPKLAGQKASYLLKQMQDFKSGARANPLMQGMVASLSENDLQNIAAYFSSLSPDVGKAKDEHVKVGQKMYEGGNPKTKVPSCIGCHSPTASGNGPARYPLLSGQFSDYSVQQLKAFRQAALERVKLTAQGTALPKVLPGRNNDENQVMQTAVLYMTDAEIEAVAAYIEGLGPKAAVQK